MKTWFDRQPNTVKASFYALCAAMLAACFTLTIRFASVFFRDWFGCFSRLRSSNSAMSSFGTRLIVTF